MVTKQGFYSKIAAEELAKWLCQDPDLYWTVDGDPILSGKLSFPCPGDELADALRQIGRPLEVLHQKGMPHTRGGTVTSAELDDLVETEELGTRVLQFRWKDGQNDWILIEDEETSESYRRLSSDEEAK